MKKKSIDDRDPAYEFTFDPTAPTENIIKAREALERYTERQKHRLGDAPPDGVGLDGYPLQGKQNEKVENDTPGHPDDLDGHGDIPAGV